MFVLTHEAPDDEEDPTITFLSGDVRKAVATALEAARGKNVLVIGANVARQCIEEGLVDEILVHLAPLLLGDGVRLFDRPGAAPVDLETTSVTQAGQLANLRFRVVKSLPRPRLTCRFAAVPMSLPLDWLRTEAISGAECAAGSLTLNHLDVQAVWSTLRAAAPCAIETLLPDDSGGDKSLERRHGGRRSAAPRKAIPVLLPAGSRQTPRPWLRAGGFLYDALQSMDPRRLLGAAPR